MVYPHTSISMIRPLGWFDRFWTYQAPRQRGFASPYITDRGRFWISKRSSVELFPNRALGIVQCLQACGRPSPDGLRPVDAKANHPKLPAGTRQEPDGLAGTELSVGCGGRWSVLVRAILTATLGRRPGHSPEWPIRRF